MQPLNPLLNTAFKAARKAGSILLRAAHDVDALKDSKTQNTFAAEIRHNTEEIIISALLEAYPDHRVCTYSGAEAGSQRATSEWLVDTLNGSADYLRGRNSYAISLALRQNGQLQEALVYAPEQNDLYTASRGKGAWLNDRRLRVSARIEPKDSLMGACAPDAASEEVATYLNIVKAFLLLNAGIRQEGAGALDLCRTAAGRTDGLFAFGLSPCALAAGVLMVQEAGGIVTDLRGDEGWLAGGGLVAANPKMLAQMLKIIGHQGV